MSAALVVSSDPADMLLEKDPPPVGSSEKESLPLSKDATPSACSKPSALRSLAALSIEL